MGIICLNCGGTRSAVVGPYKAVLPFSDQYFQGQVVKCLDCGLHFLDAPPPPDQLKKFYSEVYRQAGARHNQTNPGRQNRSFNPWSRAYAFWDLLRTQPGLPAKGKIVDVGAGWGYFLLAAKEYGSFECTAIETDQHAGAFLSESGFTVLPQLLEEVDHAAYRESFDIVSLSHVLEHSTEPKIMLGQIKDMLKPGGLAVIEVPNEDFTIPGYIQRENDAPHVVFFSRDVLRGMLERCGFTVIFCETAGWPRAMGARSANSKSFLHRLTGWLQSRVLVHLNRRWGNPEMFNYGGDRIGLRALVRKQAS